MSELSIRRAVSEDYAVIGRLLEDILKQHQNCRPDLFEAQAGGLGKYTPEEFSELLADESTVIFTACLNEQVVGYLICKILTVRKNPVLKNIKTLYLDDLCVDAKYRHIGAGKALMNAAEEYARENGFYNITLNVWEFNDNAKAFYEHLGYGTQRREMEKIL